MRQSLPVKVGRSVPTARLRHEDVTTCPAHGLAAGEDHPVKPCPTEEDGFGTGFEQIAAGATFELAVLAALQVVGTGAADDLREVTSLADVIAIGEVDVRPRTVNLSIPLRDDFVGEGTAPNRDRTSRTDRRTRRADIDIPATGARCQVDAATSDGDVVVSIADRDPRVGRCDARTNIPVAGDDGMRSPAQVESAFTVAGDDHIPFRLLAGTETICTVSGGDLRACAVQVDDVVAVTKGQPVGQAVFPEGDFVVTVAGDSHALLAVEPEVAIAVAETESRLASVVGQTIVAVAEVDVGPNAAQIGVVVGVAPDKTIGNTGIVGTEPAEAGEHGIAAGTFVGVDRQVPASIEAEYIRVTGDVARGRQIGVGVGRIPDLVPPIGAQNAKVDVGHGKPLICVAHQTIWQEATICESITPLDKCQ